MEVCISNAIRSNASVSVIKECELCWLIKCYRSKVDTSVRKVRSASSWIRRCMPMPWPSLWSGR